MFEDERFTIDQAADYLHIHPRTLRDAIDRGEVPAARIGRRIIVAKSVLLTMLGVGQTHEPARTGDPLEAA